MAKGINVGKAGEFLVCVDLTLRGYSAYLVDETLPYDILLDTGNHLLRVQVKTCGRATQTMKGCKNPYYRFKITRNRARTNRPPKYKSTDFDILALVGLDRKIIGYLDFPNFSSAKHIRADKLDDYNNLERLIT